MAQLLGTHPLDCCRACPTCARVAEARYNGRQIVVDEHDRIVEARIFTCAACGSTYSADPEPRPDATDDDVLTVTDRREWHRSRSSPTLIGVAAPASISAPGPMSRGALAANAGLYSLLGNLIDG